MTIARSRIIGIALVLASLLALGLSSYSSIKSRAFAQCQAQVNEQLVVASKARAKAAEEDRTAIADLIRAVFTATTREQSRAAYDAYSARVAQIDAERQAHPLPAPPSQLCD